jgi:hypothetical protein
MSAMNDTGSSDVVFDRETGRKIIEFLMASLEPLAKSEPGATRLLDLSGSTKIGSVMYEFNEYVLLHRGRRAINCVLVKDEENTGSTRHYSQHNLFVPGQYLNYMFGMSDVWIETRDIDPDCHLRFVDLFLDARREALRAA